MPPSLADQTTRLRRTFHYPNDSDSDDTPEAMDEQEQDNLIQTLTTQNASQNESTARVLLLLPLLSTVAYVRPLLDPKTASFAVFCLTSLLATAFLLHRLPPTETGIAAIDDWASRRNNSSSSSSSSTSASSSLRRRQQHNVQSLGGVLGRRAAAQVEMRSPLERTLPYLNLGLVVLLILMGLVRGNDRGGGFGWVSMGNVPGLVYSVAITAKIVMAGVDPERELSGLKYGYKGA
ncbi:hypothetical protein BBK36DRAFT_1125016 [Trichoderma citrinoviride]|uniref:Uncharacterized protein n=1 Tax=Trichoderma citrinoviride TaxID=58853 RepID=A0A2T4B3A1_9HYPO|nr:hypothetical protein BBK36DRAFT_1125016 [Trichoderma citrinoviride]PTB63813.1 hypothetical protein BBK36DRAFT_1125016 [Trichoderma citrinoviride]